MKYIALLVAAAGAINISKKNKNDPVTCHGKDHDPQYCNEVSKDGNFDSPCPEPLEKIVALQTGFWTQAPDGAPVENHCTNANKATRQDETCSTAGNSAWNTHTSARTAAPANAQAAPYPGHDLHVQLGFWTQAPDGAPVENHCTNANKATR